MIRTDLSDDGYEAPAMVAVERNGHRLIATLRGDLDAATAPLVGHTLLETLDPTVEELCLEIRDVAFCDSSGLKLLFRLDRAVAEHGGSLVVRDPATSVQRVLDIVDPAKTIRVQRTGSVAGNEAAAV